jgi:hypothetical protein
MFDMNRPLIDYFRCPEDFVQFRLAGPLSEDAGYFSLGPQAICYGRSAAGFRTREATGPLHDVLGDVGISDDGTLRLALDPAEIVENLRHERYGQNNGHRLLSRLARSQVTQAVYYWLRPHLPLHIRKHLQKGRLSDWRSIPFPHWPVDCTVERIMEQLLALSMKARGLRRVPFVWFWPDAGTGCVMVTHDVEELAGRNFCSRLMDLDESAGIKSSFQIVPEARYPVPEAFLDEIRTRGFEVGVHDLNHDGRLFSSRDEFQRRVQRINRYAREYRALGFRSGVLYRNQAWYDAFDFSYDMSIPNVAHLDPQRGGCCTVMPFFIGKILELPLTTVQDYSLFHILNDYSIDLWKQQLAVIAEAHGLASFNVHPDYIIERRARAIYEALLEHLVRMREERGLWMATPGEVDRWWRERSEMKVAGDGSEWRIEGKGCERARLAFANLVGDSLTFTIEKQGAAAEGYRTSTESWTRKAS